jgi:hypothetical protein
MSKTSPNMEYSSIFWNTSMFGVRLPPIFSITDINVDAILLRDFQGFSRRGDFDLGGSVPSLDAKISAGLRLQEGAAACAFNALSHRAQRFGLLTRSSPSAPGLPSDGSSVAGMPPSSLATPHGGVRH